MSKENLKLQLLEIVKDYTDKSLVQWCLFQYKKEWNNEILEFCSIYDDIWNTQTFSYLVPDKERTNEINNYKNNNDIKVLWILDITAIEKYILSNTWKINSTKDFNTKWYIILKWYTWEEDFWMPNKPINSYTEKELKDLIIKLKKLWEK